MKLSDKVEPLLTPTDIHFFHSTLEHVSVKDELYQILGRLVQSASLDLDRGSVRLLHYL